MRKSITFFVLFICISSVSSFAIDYWYLDVNTPRLGKQRAYLFRNLETLESATGFPNKPNEEGINRYRWRWSVNPTYDPNTYHARIISVMRNEGLAAAFILDGSGRSITGQLYFGYSVYFIRNGNLYYDGSTLYNNPVNFP
jgi:hypothetical protein